MNWLLAVLGVIAYAFGWGLRKGSVICATVCAPGLIPYIVDNKRDWKGGLKAGIVFNIPRIILLTILGVAVGYISYQISELEDIEDLSVAIGRIGYLLVGSLLLAYGAYTFSKTLERYEDLKEGRTLKNECTAPHSRAIVGASKWITKKRGDGFLLIWGSLLGMACIGETVIAIESALLGGFAASFGNSAWSAAAFGGIVMLAFAIGAAVPVLLVAAAAGKISEDPGSNLRLLYIQFIGSGVMMLIGLVLLIFFMRI